MYFYQLTDKSTKVGAGDHGDAVDLRSTVLAAAPLVLDRIYNAINNNVAAESPFKQKLFRYLVDYRIKWSKRGFHTPITNAIIVKLLQGYGLTETCATACITDPDDMTTGGRPGDIGWEQNDGSVKIIDRKKDLVKLQARVYVSLGKVENMCVYGDSHVNACVAIVVPE